MGDLAMKPAAPPVREIVTDTEGNFLWNAPYPFKRAHGVGESFTLKSVGYTVEKVTLDRDASGHVTTVHHVVSVDWRKR